MVGHAVDPAADVRGNVGGGATGRDGVQHVIVDQLAHVLPAALLGQRVQLGLLEQRYAELSERFLTTYEP